MRGIYTIEIENIKTKEKKVIKKENVIRDMFKKYYEIESQPPVLLGFDSWTTVFGSIGSPKMFLVVQLEENTPTTTESGEIILEGDYLDWADSGLSFFGMPLIYSNSQKMTRLFLESREIDSSGKHIKFYTEYLSGEFTVPALSIYWCCNYKSSFGASYYCKEQRLFSTTDIDPTIQVESNEQIKFYYELIQEWE